MDPADAASRCNLGVVLRSLGRFEEAQAIYCQVLLADPQMAAALANLGIVLRDQGYLAKAENAGKAAVVLDIDNPEFYGFLGVALSHQGRTDEAVAIFHRAIRLRPEYPDAHHDLAIALLKAGRFSEGLIEYEWRWQTKALASSRREFPQPEWQGESIEGKTILLHAEQGMGDAIQFCRYASRVGEQAAQVILEVHRPLVRLLGKLAGVKRIVAKGDPLPPFDLHCPLLSLPKVFGTGADSIPAVVPYLFAEAQRVAAWHKRIAPSGICIGIAWQGNPNFRADHNRSIPLAEFAPLARIPGIRLISLQKDHGLEQLRSLPFGMRVEQLGPDYDDGDFADTAAVMMCLDLVISSCTSVVHLAGALGRPTWVALGRTAHWVWLLDRDDSPWYPTLRLFRQTTRSDWQSVFEHMSAELAVMTRAG